MSLIVGDTETVAGSGATASLIATDARSHHALHALRRAAVVLGGLAAVCLSAAICYEALHRYGFGYGARAYWLAWRHDGLYDGQPERVGSYLYTPVFAQVIWPLTLLPWAAFIAVWSSLIGITFAWLLWPLPWSWRILGLLLVVPEIVDANVWAFFAVVLVVGFRRPQAWAFPLLTKVTAGVGVLWFAARREWRPALLALGTTAAVVALSAAVSPSLWHDWLVFVKDGGGRGSGYATGGRIVPPIVRLPLALVLVVLAARRNQRTWLAWAMLLAAPVFGTYNFALLAALPRLRGSRTLGSG